MHEAEVLELVEMTIPAVVLGIIILAKLTPRGFALPILLIGVFLFVVGLLINAGVAALVLVGMVGFCVVGEHYLWKKRKKSKGRPVSNEYPKARRK
jgi:hypothetical protein